MNGTKGFDFYLSVSPDMARARAGESAVFIAFCRGCRQEIYGYRAQDMMLMLQAHRCGRKLVPMGELVFEQPTKENSK